MVRERNALFVGIDSYASPDVRSLAACRADAEAMAQILRTHEDGSDNFAQSTVLLDDAVSRDDLTAAIRELFDHPGADILFYFSGHGRQMSDDGYLVTQDAGRVNAGIGMTTLLTLANNSRANSSLIILDCCHAGQMGDPLIFGDGFAILQEGVSILAASAPSELAMEIDGHGVFTRLLLGGLRGGAADLRGRISAAALYAYAEKALGERNQRPYYKSYARMLNPVRLCATNLTKARLEQLVDIFPHPDATLTLTPDFETTNPRSDPEKVQIFQVLKLYRNAGLLLLEDDLYWCAINSMKVSLNGLGKYYWELAKSGLL